MPLSCSCQSLKTSLCPDFSLLTMQVSDQRRKTAGYSFLPPNGSLSAHQRGPLPQPDPVPSTPSLTSPPHLSAHAPFFSLLGLGGLITVNLLGALLRRWCSCLYTMQPLALQPALLYSTHFSHISLSVQGGYNLPHHQATGAACDIGWTWSWNQSTCLQKFGQLLASCPYRSHLTPLHNFVHLQNWK